VAKSLVITFEAWLVVGAIQAFLEIIFLDYRAFVDLLLVLAILTATPLIETFVFSNGFLFASLDLLFRRESFKPSTNVTGRRADLAEHPILSVLVDELSATPYIFALLHQASNKLTIDHV